MPSNSSDFNQILNWKLTELLNLVQKFSSETQLSNSDLSSAFRLSNSDLSSATQTSAQQVLTTQPPKAKLLRAQ